MVVSSPEIFLITSIFRYFFPPFLSLFLITRIKREARHLWISFVRNNTSYLYEVSIYQANIPFFSTLKNFHRTNRHVIINYHLERCPPSLRSPDFHLVNLSQLCERLSSSEIFIVAPSSTHLLYVKLVSQETGDSSRNEFQSEIPSTPTTLLLYGKTGIKR